MRHILLLTDRDWTHPQGGGTGANLYGQVAHWLEWGHRVTVVAGSYAGAAPLERPAPGLELHRMGNRATVFPRAAWAVRRGLARDADVALEVINGIAFLTPLWLRLPRVALVHHVHQEHYVTELGRAGRVAGLLAEALPLRLLYRGTPFLAISDAARRDLEALGVPGAEVVYLGVEPVSCPAPRSVEPRLLYLGRLKRYKRIELLLDVVEGVPGTLLDIAGDGDHRPDLEAEIERRGLGGRVTLLGHVSEEEKARLYAGAWINVTASSAEGWCLTVMEAATCGTPSAALRVGGLPESIADGETGLLADDGPGLTEAVRRLVADDSLRARMGEAARERARGFTWERTARTTLARLEAAAGEPVVGWRAALAGAETMKAAGMAAATLVANAFGLIFTVLFARILGAADYGSLAALVSTFLILAVPGSALQAAVARETALGRLGSSAQLAATLSAWRRRLWAGGLALSVVAALLRRPIADLVSVPEAWAAAATAPTAFLWLLLSIERGALQGLHAYRPVAWSVVLENAGRLVFGLVLVTAGLGVTGAYLGTPLSMLAVALGLRAVTIRRLGAAPASPHGEAVARPRVPAGASPHGEADASPHGEAVARPRVPAGASPHGEADASPHGEAVRGFGELIGRAWPAVLGLFLVAVLQNVDVIMVKRQIGGEAAGAYAAAAVAAKAVVWVAIGIGLYLLPEAARASRTGGDPRRVLVRALAVVGAVAVPMLAVYAAMPETVLRLAFGPDTVQAADALLVLGCAMTLLAVGYLGVQYMLALGRLSFLWALGLVAVAEVALLGGADLGSLVGFAGVVLVLQAVAAACVLTLGFARRAAVP